LTGAFVDTDARRGRVTRLGVQLQNVFQLGQELAINRP
jgi:hypothetical protein